MNSSGLKFIMTWGLWILVLGIVVAIALMWCHDVNQKLRYILGQLGRINRDAGDRFVTDNNFCERKTGTAHGKTVSPLIAGCIIGAAIFILFILPLWLINR